jgi:hypothetical protein
MTDDTLPVEKTKTKKMPVIAIVGIGCLGILLLLGIGLTVAGKVLLSKIGTNLIKQGVESKTGIKIDTNNKSGSMSFTDSKTGETVNIGEQKIPDSFPKDFPIYPGAKSTGSLSGNNQKAQSQGFWIILSTPDSLNQVISFYSSNLAKNGWVIDNTTTLNEMNIYTVKKGTLSGGVTVNRGKDEKQTTITISLATDNSDNSASEKAPSDNPTETTSEEPSM